MANKELNALTKILEAASNFFHLYGYHGAILQPIVCLDNTAKGVCLGIDTTKL